jgi:excisionase family DNA binding protein
MAKEFFDIYELSECLGIKKSTLYSMVENKEIPFFRFGRLLRFKKQEIDDWVEGHREESIDPAKKGREIFKGVKNSKMDVDRMVQKSIESVKNSGYNRCHGKPDRIKGLRKEVEDGTL